MSEQEIQKEIYDFLKKCGLFVWRNHTQGVMVGGRRRVANPNAGAPDLLACWNGRLICIEVKTAKGKVDLHQLDWLGKASRAGALTLIARSLDDVITFLERHEIIKPTPPPDLKLGEP